MRMLDVGGRVAVDLQRRLPDPTPAACSAAVAAQGRHFAPRHRTPDRHESRRPGGASVLSTSRKFPPKFEVG
jgi:hypothetical protein